MKTFGFAALIFFIFISKSFAETPLGNDWMQKGQLSETRIFEKKEMSLSVFEGAFSDMSQFTVGNYKTEVLNSAEPRKKVLELLGTTNWQINDMSFVENKNLGKNAKMIQLRGQFLRDNMNYEFIEWQVYSENKLVKLQLENKIGGPSVSAEIPYLIRWIQDLK